MATNMIFRYNGELTRERALSLATAPAAPSTIQPGAPVLFPEGPAVSLTASGNGSVTVSGAGNLPTGITSVTYGNGGVGNLPASASFAFDGSWEFAVAGATTSTANGVAVYITPAGGLTLTESTNTKFGTTDYPRDYAKVAGRSVVQIGA